MDTFVQTLKFNGMKKNVFVLFIGLSFLACNQKTTDKTIIGKAMTTSDFFDAVSAMDVKNQEHAIYLETRWDQKNKLIAATNIIEKEPDFFVIDFPNNDVKKKYTVTCTNGKNEWTKGCDGKLSCGGLVSDCLAEGGCATICTAKVIYVPQMKSFYIESAHASIE